MTHETQPIPRWALYLFAMAFFAIGSYMVKEGYVCLRDHENRIVAVEGVARATESRLDRIEVKIDKILERK